MLLLAALVLACPTVDAADKKKDPKKEAREKLSAAKEKYFEAIDEVLEPKDKNKDGSLTRDEFIADESDKEGAGKRFDEANKNRDRVLHKNEIGEMLGADKELEKVKDEIEQSQKKKKK